MANCKAVQQSKKTRRESKSEQNKGGKTKEAEENEKKVRQ